MLIRKALLNEASFLSELSVRSKSYWGYDKKFMRDALEDLTLNPTLIQKNLVHLCESESNILGYYAFSENHEPEMTALFVEPNFIGKGVGLKLWQHSLIFAKSKNWVKFKIVADPFAAKKFYLRLGCQQIGEYQSPVRKGRKLPLLEYILK